MHSFFFTDLRILTNKLKMSFLQKNEDINVYIQNFIKNHLLVIYITKVNKI